MQGFRWVSDFAIAKRMGIPVHEVENLSTRWYARAALMLDVERVADEMRGQGGVT